MERGPIECEITALRINVQTKEWATEWGSDSATEAIAAYKGLEFGPASLKADGKINRIEILPPKDYDEQQLPRVKTQLEKSCVHLAQLLNSVEWE